MGTAAIKQRIKEYITKVKKYPQITCFQPHQLGPTKMVKGIWLTKIATFPQKWYSVFPPSGHMVTPNTTGLCTHFMIFWHYICVKGLSKINAQDEILISIVVGQMVETWMGGRGPWSSWLQCWTASNYSATSISQILLDLILLFQGQISSFAQIYRTTWFANICWWLHFAELI